MKRLTKKLHDGTPWYNHSVEKEVTAEDMLQKLFLYEESGLDPHRVLELALAEKHNRLMIQPCAMYDRLYMVIEKMSRGSKPKPYMFIKRTKLMPSNLFRVMRDFGKTVFLTSEEACNYIDKSRKRLEGEV